MKTLIRTHKLLKKYDPLVNKCLNIYDYYIPETLEKWIEKLNNKNVLKRSHKLLLRYIYILRKHNISCVDVPESLNDWCEQCDPKKPKFNEVQLAWIKGFNRGCKIKGIIDKLPRTADGVPIVPGMKLYFVDTTGKVICGEANTYQYRNKVWYLIILSWAVRADKCYSSREALSPITNDDIVEFLSRDDVFINSNILYYKGFIINSINIVEAAKIAIKKEREV